MPTRHRRTSFRRAHESREADLAEEDLPIPFVHADREFKALHFSISATQSRMRIAHPDALELSYTRTMLGFLAFVQAPRRILMIGLGGGSLPKYCFRKFPDASICVVEINPHVIALRDEFRVPPDGDRFEVILGDGAAIVRERRATEDVLIVDGFDREGQVPALATTRFYQDAWRALRPGGVMVVNLHLTQSRADHYAVRRIRPVFGPQVLCLEEPDGCNLIVFARKCDGLPAEVESRAIDQDNAFDPWSNGVLVRIGDAWNTLGAQTGEPGAKRVNILATPAVDQALRKPWSKRPPG